MPASAMAKIVVEVRYANRPPEVREFNQAKVIIGRDSGNIVLGDQLASGRHAELNITSYGVTLADLGSTNGTFMASGERVTSQMPLRPGSEFRIGACTLVLSSFESPAALGPKGTLVMTAADSDRAQAQLAETAAAAPGTASTPHEPPAPWAPTGSPGGLPMPSPPQQPGGLPMPSPPQQPGGLPMPNVPQQPGAAPWGQPPGPAQPFGAQPGGYPQPAAYQPQAGYQPHGYQQAGGYPSPAQPGQPAEALGVPGAFAGSGMGGPPGAQAGLAVGAGYQPAGIGGAAPGQKNDPMGLLSSTFQQFKPNAVEAIKSIGLFSVPLPLLGALLGYIPVVGGILAMIFMYGAHLVYLLFGVGVQAEVGLRLAVGAPFTANEVWKLQMKRLVPWFVGILVPLLLAGLGSLLCIVPGILFGLFIIPIYMVETLRGIDVNKRSFEILQKDWALALVPLLIVWIPSALALTALHFIFGLIPFIGAILVALLGGITQAVLGPFVSHLVFRIYAAIREKAENRSIQGELQAAVGRG